MKRAAREPGHVALLAAFAAALALGVGLRARAGERPATTEAAPPGASVAGEPSEPCPGLEPCASIPPAEVVALEREAVPADPSSPSRVLRARRELAAWLVAEPFDRPALERAAAALAAPLTDEELAELRAPAETDAMPELLAGLELLAARDAGPGTLGPRERIALLDQLAREPASLAESAARLLGRLGDARDRAQLVAGLDDPSATVRARCLRALLTLARAPEFQVELAGLAEQGAAGAERAALRTFLTQRTSEVAAPRARLASTDLPRRARLAAAAELLRTESDAFEARAYLADALADPEPEFRRRALLGLAGGLTAPEAVLVAELARHDPDPATRCAAVRALEPERDRAQLEDLEREDSVPEVRALAAQRARRRP